MEYATEKESEEGVPLEKRSRCACGGREAVRTLRRRVPALRWVADYSRTAALADVVAGATLGLTLVPQSIAYATLAELPMHYGLYSSFIGTMLYVLLGTVKEVSIGPTSLMALLTLHTCRGLSLDYIFLLTFLSGCVVLMMGLLQLGFLVNLISPSVTSGFTSGTAVIIVVAQLKGLLGLSFTAETIWENAYEIALQWRKVRLADCLLSVACCTVLLLLRKLKDVKVNPKRHKLKKTLWLISIARNAIVVCASALFAYCTYDPDRPLLKLSGRVEPGLPPLALPPFSVEQDGEHVGFMGMLHRLGGSVLLIPLVMVISNISIAKAFSAGKRVDATQEMLTLGLVNIAGSFVHAMPTCGAFTRSAVSHSSGVRTPAAGLYSGIITLLALSFMTPCFYFIPKACLSSVLICAVIFMVDVTTVRRLFSHNRSELCVLSTTFGVCVALSVELGVLVGAAASLVVLLRTFMRPTLRLRSLKMYDDAVVARPLLALLYLNVERFVTRIRRATADSPAATALVDCSDLVLIDYTSEQVINRLAKEFNDANQRLIFYNASSEVLRILKQLDNVEQRALEARSVADALRLVGACAGYGKTEIEPLLTNGQQNETV